MEASDVRAALAALEDSLPRHALGIVLGSGLGALVEQVEPRASIPYADVPGFPACRVAGHAGILHTGRIGGRPLVVFEGRVHLYEGASVAEVTFAVRLLRALAARAVVLTTAAGAVAADYRTGELVLLRDHINLTGEDPGRGEFPAGDGVRLASGHAIYSPVLLERATALAFGLGVPYHRGVLAGVRGPSYETPAEVRALRALGADLVSMSVVLEAMAAARATLPLLGLALVSNRAGDPATSHEGVLEAARHGGKALIHFLTVLIEELDWTVAD